MTKMNDDGGLIGMRTEDLRVQALKNPLGINENPVFRSYHTALPDIRNNSTSLYTGYSQSLST